MSDRINANHWRDLAEETKVAAERIRYSERERLKLLRVAEEFQRLAEFSEQRQTDSEADH